MTRVLPTFITLVITFWSSSTMPLAQTASSAQAALRTAIDLEMVTGDAPGAVKLYLALIDRYEKTERTIVAKALSRLGMLQEKLGDTAQARAAYARLVADFADQPREHAEAQARLAALPGDDGPFASAVLQHLDAREFNNWPEGFSSDGARVAVGSDVGGGGPPPPALLVRDLNTGRETLVGTRLPGSSVQRPSISPDGQYAGAWLYRTGTPQGPEWSYSLVVGRIASPSTPIVLASIYGGNDFRLGPTNWLEPGLAWSPNGRFVPYAAPSSTKGMFTATLLDVRSGISLPLGIELTTAPDFRWSPTGDELAVRVVDATSGLDEARIYTLATKQVRRVSLNATAGQFVRLESWTTSGDLYLRRMTSTPNNSEFQLLNLQTGSIRTTCVGLAATWATTGSFGLPYSNPLPAACLGITPDGQRQLIWKPNTRQVFVLTIATGVETPLTTSSGEERLGFLSPDGKTVAFLSNRDGTWGIYAALVDGAPNPRPALLGRLGKLPTGIKVSWLRDGIAIWLRTSETNVYRVDMNPSTGKSTGDVERLTQEAADNWYPSVSPDSRRVAYLTQQDGRVSVSVMDANGANERQVVNSFPPSYETPSWQSSSQLLTRLKPGPGEGMGPRTWKAADIQSGVPRDVTTIPGLEGTRGMYRTFDYVVALGELVYVANPRANGSITLRARRLSDGADREFVKIPTPTGFLTGFLVSPDGRRVAYLLDSIAEPGPCTPCEFGVLTVDTGEKRLLPAPNRAYPLVSWSPEGRFFLYGSVRPRIMDTAIGESWLLIDEATQRMPGALDLQAWGDDSGGSWSPDGKFITFSLGNDRHEWRRWTGVTREALAKMRAER